MGQIIRASCPCGYKNDSIRIGGGVRDTGKKFSFPAYCPGKEPHIVSANLCSKTLRCSPHKTKPILYNDESLIGKRGRSIRVSFWAEAKEAGSPPLTFELTSGTYLCPACQNYTLKFSAPYICFD